jgi:hypothetical protein
VSRLPITLVLLVLALFVPATVASAADEGAPGASIAQDEDATDAGTTDEADTNGDGSITCEDFTTQDDAQIYFDGNPDATQLDEDSDGIVCEDLATVDDPTGGVHTGDGGTAVVPGPVSEDGSGTASGALLVLVALLAAAGGLVLLRRRPLRR